MRIFKSILVIFIIAIIGFGCGNNKKEIIKIGVIIPLTGDASEYGNDQKRGIEIALKHYKDSLNNKNVQLEIVFEDSKSNSKDGINAYNKLISQNIKIFFSTLSNVSMAIQPLIKKNNNLFFTIAAHPELTTNKAKVIRMLPTSSYYAKKLSFYVSNFFNKPSIGILFSNDDFGNSLKEAFKEVYILDNGEIVISNSYEKNKMDYRSEITKIINKKPISIFLVGYGKDLGTIIKQFRELGYVGKIFGTPEISYPDVKTIAGETYDNIYYISMKIDNETDIFKKFHSIYLKEYKINPSLDSYLGYDEAGIICKSILLKKSVFFANDIDSIEVVVKSAINNYDGLTGCLNINQNGDVYFPLALKSIKNGKEIPLNFESKQQ